MKQIKNIAIHILAWIGYLLTIVFGTPDLDENFWITFFCTNVPLVVLFYGNTEIIFPKLLQKKNYIGFAIAIIFFTTFTVLLRFVLAMIILDAPLSDLLDAQNGPRVWGQVRFSLLFTGISFAVWYAKRNMEMSKKQQLLQKEVTDAQLMSLKNQINPHFLYNTLSFLYTKSLPLSEELSQAIAKLSEMMRYSLGEAGADGKVPLQSEINHLKNFIDIHQLRYSNSLYVKFEVDGDVTKHKIVPLLLITFVENAFKHGKINDEEHPVSIHLHANQKSSTFTVINKKHNGMKEKSSGIGLQNIRNRLNLVYASKHDLAIEDTHDYFRINLRIEN